MSRLVTRILLSALIVPLGLLFDLILYFTIDWNLFQRSRSSDWTSNLTTAALMMIAWLLIWRSQVHWTRRRLRLTTATLGGAAVIGAVVGWFLGGHDFDELGIFAGSMAFALSWMAAMLLVWRETAAERGQRISRAGRDVIVCPTCGYNMTGLSEARCPECGSRFTIEELIASQPGRAQRELEVPQ